jgi:hypothetical protein
MRNNEYRKPFINDYKHWMNLVTKPTGYQFGCKVAYVVLDNFLSDSLNIV